MPRWDNEMGKTSSPLSLISKSNLHGRIDNWKKDGLVGALHGFGYGWDVKNACDGVLFESLFYMFRG
jgi:hypothetical protein